MADSSHTRVAVYLDFDNIVISRYDHVFGRSSWRNDDARNHGGDATSGDPVDKRLAEAEVDVGAVLDYASSFGTVALARAYADWSVTANAAYKKQLINRAVDLTQLFTTTGGMKNGADIRLSVDAMEDLFQLDDLTHVVIVAGDSDYIALAQRCKRLGRFVVGIGVTGSTSPALVAACDEFSDYDELPGVKPPHTTGSSDEDVPVVVEVEKAAAAASKQTRKTAARKTAKKAESGPQAAATALLLRAIRVGQSTGDDEWLYSGGVKSQMQRMDSIFKEKSLGFSSFRDFAESRSEAVETKMAGQQLQLRLR
ncbi:MAG: NYN domain-containing protein [Marmoricola sp.]